MVRVTFACFFCGSPSPIWMSILPFHQGMHIIEVLKRLVGFQGLSQRPLGTCGPTWPTCGPKQVCTTAQLLGSVCCSWRAPSLSLAIPRLWTTIYLKLLTTGSFTKHERHGQNALIHSDSDKREPRNYLTLKQIFKVFWLLVPSGAARNDTTKYPAVFGFLVLSLIGRTIDNDPNIRLAYRCQSRNWVDW